jgi:DNA-binding transcriptional ArsR family regulator
MNIEALSELQRRAAKHAALSDPARLLIVDTLSLGDASPSELQALLAMPSNLLAHHLRVLEHEGMVVRTRSEADRRRSYLRLVPAALDGLVPRADGTAARVVFVCTANAARSQLAAPRYPPERTRRSGSIPVPSRQRNVTNCRFGSCGRASWPMFWTSRTS